MKDRYGRFFINSLACCLGLMFSIIIVEVCLRLYPHSRNKYAFFRYYQKDVTDWFSNLQYRPSALLGYECIPGRGVCNANGVIGPIYPLKKGADTYRILVLGDSITADDYYVRSLERKLNNTEGLPFVFQAWNAGVDGYSVYQYARYLEHRGLRLEPDMVLLGLYLNDCDLQMFVFYQGRDGVKQYYYPGFAMDKFMPLNRFLFQYSYLYRCVVIELNRLLETRASKGQARHKTDGLYYLARIRAMCGNRGIPLICAIFPSMRPTSEYEKWESEGYKEILSALRQLSIDYIDLSDYFPGNERYSLRRDSEDFIHPNKQGHGIAAGAIYKHLLDYFFEREISAR